MLHGLQGKVLLQKQDNHPPLHPHQGVVGHHKVDHMLYNYICLQIDYMISITNNISTPGTKAAHTAAN